MANFVKTELVYYSNKFSPGYVLSKIQSRGLLCVLTVALSVSVFPEGAAAQEKITALNNEGVRLATDGYFSEGASRLREALRLKPDDESVKKNLSGILTDWAVSLRNAGKWDQAEALLKEAVVLEGANGLAWVHLGDLLFLARDDIAGALEAWKNAYQYADSKAQTALAQRVSLAERDRAQDRTLQTRSIGKFHIKYPSDTEETVLKDFEAFLISEHDRQQAFFGSLKQPVIVLLYPAKSFARVAGTRDWAVGLYDGKIRLRIDEIGSTSQEVIVPHELAHAFIRQIYGDHIPMWLNEGLAQLQEPERTLTPEGKRLLKRIRDRNLWVPLPWLDRRFQQPSSQEDLEAAYLQARVAVDALISRFGDESMRRFLKAIASGEPFEEAFDNHFKPHKWKQMAQGVFP